MISLISYPVILSTRSSLIPIFHQVMMENALANAMPAKIMPTIKYIFRLKAMLFNPSAMEREPRVRSSGKCSFLKLWDLMPPRSASTGRILAAAAAERHATNTTTAMIKAALRISKPICPPLLHVTPTELVISPPRAAMIP